MNGPLVIGGATLHQGDCLRALKTMPDRSIQCCVTSPPYFGLRSYMDDAHPDKAAEIGTEQTPDEYVAKLVAVFAEVRRVLKDDGVCWVNLGDSYANDAKWGGSSGGKHVTALHGDTGIGRGKKSTGLKPKDLIGIPWRVAFALQADGFYLRQDIVWKKKNPMPESVKDRCTKAHEYLFLLTKNARYFWDAEAMRENAVTDVAHKHWTDREHDQSFLGRKQANGCKGRPVGVAGYTEPGKRNRRSVWTIASKPYRGAHFAVMPAALVEPCILAGSRPNDVILDPFAGSGTVGEVALKHGRAFVGIDLGFRDLQVERIGAAQIQERLNLEPAA